MSNKRILKLTALTVTDTRRAFPMVKIAAIAAVVVLVLGLTSVAYANLTTANSVANTLSGTALLVNNQVRITAQGSTINGLYAFDVTLSGVSVAGTTQIVTASYMPGSTGGDLGFYLYTGAQTTLITLTQLDFYRVADGYNPSTDTGKRGTIVTGLALSTDPLSLHLTAADLTLNGGLVLADLNLYDAVRMSIHLLHTWYEPTAGGPSGELPQCELRWSYHHSYGQPERRSHGHQEPAARKRQRFQPDRDLVPERRPEPRHAQLQRRTCKLGQHRHHPRRHHHLYADSRLQRQRQLHRAGERRLSHRYRTITVTVVPPPTVTAISPNAGPTAGGTAVTITGTNFTGATSVTIGGAATTSVVVVNATTITATTPAGTAGAQDVVVTTPAGNGTGTGLFTYCASAITVINNSSSGAGSLRQAIADICPGGDDKLRQQLHHNPRKHPDYCQEPDDRRRGSWHYRKRQ